MSIPNVLVGNTTGLNSHPNELAVPPGSTSVADNVTFSREGLPERRNGFKDHSSNLPDFAPAQLLVGSNGTDKYLHLDNGLWYWDTGASGWVRKEGSDTAIFLALAGIWVDATETYAYLTDRTNHAVFRMSIAGGQIELFAGLPGTSGTTSATGSAARFNTPVGIWGDGTNLYVADNGNFAIRKIVISTRAVTDFSGLSGTSGTANSTGTTTRYQSPYGIWGDGTNLYVSEKDHGRIRKVVISSSSTSNLTTGLTSPKGVWIAAAGATLYVSTNNAANIRTVNATSGADAAFASGLTGDASGHSLMHSDGTYLWVPTYDNSNVSRVAVSGGAVNNAVFPTFSAIALTGVWVFSGKLWLVGSLAPMHVAYPSTGKNYRLVYNSGSGARISGATPNILQGPS